MRRLLFICLLLWLPLLAAASSAGAAAGPATATERFVLGVLATRPLALVEQEHQPLADYLAEQLNAEVRLRVLDFAALQHALELGQIDFCSPALATT